MKQIFIYYLSPEHTGNLEYDTPTCHTDDPEDKFIDAHESRNKAIIEHQDSVKYSILDFILAFNEKLISDQGWLAFNEEESNINTTKEIIKIDTNLYQLVQWPDSQEYMEEEWFDNECSLADYEQFGDAAYFIPVIRIEEYEKKRLTIIHCQGFEHSNCCTGGIDEDSKTCIICKEHCTNFCHDCEFAMDCEKRKDLNE